MACPFYPILWKFQVGFLYQRISIYNEEIDIQVLNLSPYWQGLGFQGFPAPGPHGHKPDLSEKEDLFPPLWCLMEQSSV